MKKLHPPTTPAQADNFLSEPSKATSEALGRISGPVVVLGAGGKMGLHVASMLHKADQVAGRTARVTAVSRFASVHGTDAFTEQGIPVLACDLEDESALAQLPDTPNIIYMAGAKFGTGDNPDLLRRMNVELPRKIAKRFAGSRCLAFSTGCVYTMVPADHSGSIESDATEGTGDYAASCIGRETAFTEGAHAYGSPTALIRLNYATEFRYGVLVDIAQRVLSEEPVELGMGWVNVIWQRDAVDQILQAFPHATPEPFILNITGAEKLGVRDLAERFGKIFGKKPHFSGQEKETAWISDASRSHRLFGPPSTSTDTMVEWTAAWLLNGGETFNKPTGFQVRDGKY